MPELPEVETVVRDLRPLLTGRRLTVIHVGKAKLRRPWKAAWGKKLTGSTISSIRRRGKWIILDLDPAAHLIVHLGMTGQFTVNTVNVPTPDHTHLVFTLDDGNELRFRDVRRFGSVEWFAHADDVNHFLGERLGPEPFDMPAKQFHESLMSSKRTLKALLLDQTVVAGVGNIYADEALFRAGLHPECRGNAMTAKDCDRLRLAIVVVLTKAIESRGSTIRDYIGGSGLRGGFQDEFTVYGRTGEPCVKCNTPIERIRVAGRSSHYCPQCQQR